MVRERLARYRDAARQQLVAAFREEHTPHQVAASFAIGIFITALPTGGLGIGLFFVFISLWSSISKPAIFASVAVLNPFVKPAVYLASFQVGAFLLGSESVRSRDATTTESAWVAIQQLLLGNAIIAVVLSALSYVTVLHLTRLHRRRGPPRSGLSLTSFLLGPFRRQ
ncbi:DUF2062 domain-containing protein [Natronorubrum sp. JWXQ-INN-674]|uniref:DUF2062 domain-containing protein n=1 Tax=Natronorubrum halalkaliphilum TaxID=2691917 RepID=A0A6B0VRN5_9EURY|nr:DUF2062 domain-containing protein [Natronorubrum halalkaliphilum]MXV64188.1 DUF2062 domain-containing protein [Natronorubrum halalkaliphilum]